jgi:hypothetical protein
MKDFSQEFYNWLIEEKKRIKKKVDEPDIPIDDDIVNPYILIWNTLNKIEGKYKEICFREEAEK